MKTILGRELINPTVGERQPYACNLRSNRNITHVARRQGLSRSFFPTVIREWNSLLVEIRLAERLHGFSKGLDALYPSPPKRSWFSIGERLIRPNKLTLMVLVGARTTFSSRTNFFFFKQINLKKKIKKKN